MSSNLENSFYDFLDTGKYQRSLDEMALQAFSKISGILVKDIYDKDNKQRYRYNSVETEFMEDNSLAFYNLFRKVGR